MPQSTLHGTESEDKTDWFTAFEKKMTKHTFSGREYRLFHISRFIRSGRWVDCFSTQCRSCDDFRSLLMASAEKLEEYLRSSTGGAVEYENLSDRVYHHLRKDHRLIPRAYYPAVYSLAGMAAGTLAGGLTGYMYSRLADLKDAGLTINALLLGWFFGLVAGQLLGKKKEKTIRQLNRQF